MLNPLHLRTFSVVMRLGSFAAAGRELGYTGSAVSQQISALETQTGLTLFERYGHNIRATQSARMLSERAGETLSALNALEQAVGEMATGARGRLGLGSFPTASEVLIPAVLGRFSRVFPDVEVRFHDGEPEFLVPRLLEGDLDLLVSYRYDLVPRGWPAAVHRTPVMAEELRLLVPPSYQTAGREFTLSDFAEAPWISTREESAGNLAVERACAAAGFSPEIKYRTNDYDVIASFVLAGLGVAAVPLLAYGNRSDLTTLSPTDFTIRRHIELLTIKGSADPAVDSLIATIQTEAANLSSRHSSPSLLG
ncbi:LysR family transcriptional regulator [Nesterenkonia natronophila]|uniref:LysR family transcriptional regulator n=1 Tax=Nesterenkonia natronophila TaxID=2174932 RepID=A0A3A4F519_9MICC|nr:LysR family transcriptional regulator [Nesterenkonia natronophila]RJN32988.1 LysR family transcriptional regulator [Nesterenkonia natronophila]